MSKVSQSFPPVLVMTSNDLIIWLQMLERAAVNYGIGNTIEELDKRLSNSLPSILLIDFAIEEHLLVEIRKHLIEHNAFARVHIVGLLPFKYYDDEKEIWDPQIIDEMYRYGVNDIITANTPPQLVGDRLRIALRDRQKILKTLKRLEAASGKGAAGGAIWIYDPDTGMAHVSWALREMMGLDPSHRLLPFEDFLRNFSNDERINIRRAVRTVSMEHKSSQHISHASISERIGRADHIIDFQEEIYGDTTRIRGLIMPVEEMELDAGQLFAKDRLTGLPTVDLLMGRLSMVLTQQAKENDGKKAALLVLDVDRFKHLHITHGRERSERLLDQLSQRIQKTLAEEFSRRLGNSSAKNAFYVASLSVDEFAIVLSSIDGSDDAAEIANLLLSEVVEPFDVGDKSLFIAARIGIAMMPDDGEKAETALANAQLALDQAKSEMGSSYHFYSPVQAASTVARIELVNELRRGFNANELRVRYQPQIDTHTNRIMGVEALVRWQHPEYGLMMPNSFIPVAEETGVINDIARFVLQQSIKDARYWDGCGLPKLQVAVNISPDMFAEQNMVAELKEIVAAEGFDPARITIEITETAVMKDMETSVFVMNELRSIGMKMALDDFGTGYSSLGYLKNLPFDYLKIDRSFIKDLHEDDSGHAMVRAIIDISRNLGMSVVAEGVENETQLAWLQAERCTQYQGFYCSPAVAADKLVDLINKWHDDADQSRLVPFISPQKS